jgi:hypothetical protein
MLHVGMGATVSVAAEANGSLNQLRPLQSFVPTWARAEHTKLGKSACLQWIPTAGSMRALLPLLYTCIYIYK